MFRPEVMQTIEDKLDELDSELRELSLKIHDHPELMFQERYAHDTLSSYMESQGFHVTPHYLGLETAWRAQFSFGEGGRTIGVNSEMDALPCGDTKGASHSCGHNLIAVAGVGVAVALKRALEVHNTTGTVVLLGTPAEEGGGGKEILLQRGAYRHMDACVMCHPIGNPLSQKQHLLIGSSLSLQYIEVEYFGHSAHAGLAPWEGTNALDAAFAAYSNIAVLRQQIKPDCRVTGVIQGKDNGWVPNIIPDYAKMIWIIRAPTSSELSQLRERVVNCLQAGALATGCKMKMKLGTHNDDLRQNRVLAQELASIYQHRYSIPTQFKGADVGASTDFGNITYALPGLHPVFSIPSDSANHTEGFAKAARSIEAHKSTMLITKGLALTAFRVLDDDDFWQKVRTDYEQRGPRHEG